MHGNSHAVASTHVPSIPQHPVEHCFALSHTQPSARPVLNAHCAAHTDSSAHVSVVVSQHDDLHSTPPPLLPPLPLQLHPFGLSLAAVHWSGPGDTPGHVSPGGAWPAITGATSFVVHNLFSVPGWSKR